MAYLADAGHFPGHPRTVEVIETHFAWVFLAGSRAFKLKKPLRRASMDYCTLARRERACREELRLNRRLAPGVYLRVVPLWRSRDGSLSRRAGGRIVDWLVEMRRLPASARLDQALADRAVRARDVERIVARLAAFFSRAAQRPMTDRAYVARLRRQVLSSTRELDARDLGLDHRQVAGLGQAQLAFLTDHAGLFKSRGSRLRDGHGDLRPEHVFLKTPVAGISVIDCLEFDRVLRRLDPVEEIALLALECGRLGARQVADRLLERYRCVSGDPASQSLCEFYMSRRAAVRAQLAAWHLRDTAFADERRTWQVRARSYLRDAVHLCRLAEARARSSGRRPPSPRGAGPPPERRRTRLNPSGSRERAEAAMVEPQPRNARLRSPP